MKKEFTLRRKIAFVNILKWFLAAAFIGVTVGIFNSLFLKLLSASTAFTGQFKYYYLILPFALFITHYLALKIYPRDRDYSTNDAIGKINSKKPISIISSLKAFFLPVITIAAGGSAGKEPPCADVGAGTASFFAQLLKFNPNERRKLMICGVSAGFAGVFGVPISGALFGLEVLCVGNVLYEVMFPALIAGITSFQVTHMMGVDYVYHTLSLKTLNIDSSLLQVMAAGLFFGLISLLFIEIMKLAKILLRFLSARFNYAVRCFVGSLVVILIAFLASPMYLGLGMQSVEGLLAGQHMPLFAFLLKMLSTAFTFAAGGVGGLITPIFFIGAHAGNFFAQITGLNPVTFAALGIVSVLAGVANTPLAASVMAIELFGATIAPYAAVSCILSFMITGQRSIFSKQKFNFIKKISDDEPWEEQKQETVEELESKLRKKNILLSSVKHLIPDFKEEHQPAQAQKTSPKKSFFNKFFGHLFIDIKGDENDGDKIKK